MNDLFSCYLTQVRTSVIFEFRIKNWIRFWLFNLILCYVWTTLFYRGQITKGSYCLRTTKFYKLAVIRRLNTKVEQTWRYPKTIALKKLFWKNHKNSICRLKSVFIHGVFWISTHAKKYAPLFQKHGWIKFEIHQFCLEKWKFSDLTGKDLKNLIMPMLYCLDGKN